MTKLILLKIYKCVVNPYQQNLTVVYNYFVILDLFFVCAENIDCDVGACQPNIFSFFFFYFL